MNISIKTPDEIEIMRQGGRILSDTLCLLAEKTSVGKVIADLDKQAEDYLIKYGAKPSFKNYSIEGIDKPFPSTVCISINDEVVHGFGNRDIVLKEGDVVGFDLGCWYKGLCTDMAATVCVGSVSSSIKTFVEITKKALFSGVLAVRSGNNVIDISSAIETTIKPYGYGIVRELVGHGVGYKVHEEPSIPNFIDYTFPNPELKVGMCLALEPMTSMGRPQVINDQTGWIIKTQDQSISAHFEVTVVVTDEGNEILTPLPL
ncbi:type I methionyl aminopeptidase [Candidatus Uhrbacteria bacterium CG_4_9_14_3_um_filter_36_7]|uniref:Methionine aminopeptidase n=1 Tax=Candidatus Uhrbacteria bacterium CG_4_9_14_3_um_filter_36_7 TaxID=1975033 RepID=A0A2M7XIC5_9BACT|nr:MAG: type I methionyl aminopeptidase [Candidatus Uhrbacteria bacterium CG_4_9_14_3_um_filter_36_7]